jgi:hypothetical protein
VLVHVAPVFIGAGTPAYRSEGDAVVEFDVLESSSPGELTTLRLRPRKEGPQRPR